MGNLTKNFSRHFPKAAGYILNWNKNYFPLLQQHFGDPSKFNDQLKIIWENGFRKVVYCAVDLTIQLHEHTDSNEWKSRLVGKGQYPSEQTIKGCAEWFRGEIEIKVFK